MKIHVWPINSIMYCIFQKEQFLRLHEFKEELAFFILRTAMYSAHFLIKVWEKIKSASSQNFQQILDLLLSLGTSTLIF